MLSVIGRYISNYMCINVFSPCPFSLSLHSCFLLICSQYFAHASGVPILSAGWPVPVFSFVLFFLSLLKIYYHFTVGGWRLYIWRERGVLKRETATQISAASELHREGNNRGGDWTAMSSLNVKTNQLGYITWCCLPLPLLMPTRRQVVITIGNKMYLPPSQFS